MSKSALYHYHKSKEAILYAMLHSHLTQVLRQVRSAERKARLQIGRRDVELAVLAYRVHYLEGVDSQRFAQPRRLVGERDLQRMKIVAGVLRHFRCANRRDMELAGQMAE